MPMRYPQFLSLLVFFVLVAAAALTGAQFEPGTWYESLAKPPWTPPSWIFGPVWTVLYVAIAVAGWVAWREAGGRVSLAVVLWIFQLLFNASWSWLFFGLQAPVLALINIVVLLAAIIAFIVTAGSRLAVGLFLPYALWVAFAGLLNLEIVRLNW
jgi:translocator protein